MIVPPSKTIELISSVGPFTSREGGFRLNKCTGYLNKIYKIDPELPNDCPLPDIQKLYFFNPECQKFIRDINRCTVPVIQPIQLNILRDDSCTKYIAEHFNYNGCVKDYQFDKDFYKDEWRVYLGYSNDIWDDIVEYITLRDTNGFLIDTYYDSRF